MKAPRLVRAAAFALAAAAGAALPAGGCESGEIKLCGEIPENGCPLGRGGSCDDAFCSGLYDCVEGKWTLAVDCSDRNPPGGDAGSGDAASDAACTPVTLSHEGETTNCSPDLENPDCPAAAAEAACRESVCLTSCTDFFLCTKDKDGKAGWALAAYCEDDGHLVISQ